MGHVDCFPKSMQRQEIRSELIAQHRHLRSEMSALRSAAQRCLRGDDAWDELRHGLIELTRMLRVHNAREEALMADVFPDLDAWGPIRQQVMDEEHVAEHAKTEAALTFAIAEHDVTKAVSATVHALDELASHMDREEKVFLSTDVLTDEPIQPDSFGG